MKVTIYRASVRHTYPEQTAGAQYSFAALEAHAYGRPGSDLATGFRAGSEVAAVVEAPEGSELAESPGGETLLFVPGEPAGYSARQALDVFGPRED